MAGRETCLYELIVVCSGWWVLGWLGSCGVGGGMFVLFMILLAADIFVSYSDSSSGSGKGIRGAVVVGNGRCLGSRSTSISCGSCDRSVDFRTNFDGPRDLVSVDCFAVTDGSTTDMSGLAGKVRLGTGIGRFMGGASLNSDCACAAMNKGIIISGIASRDVALHCSSFGFAGGNNRCAVGNEILCRGGWSRWSFELV